jgi:hypothetical protein
MSEIIKFGSSRESRVSDETARERAIRMSHPLHRVETAYWAVTPLIRNLDAGEFCFSDPYIAGDLPSVILRLAQTRADLSPRCGDFSSPYTGLDLSINIIDPISITQHTEDRYGPDDELVTHPPGSCFFVSDFSAAERLDHDGVSHLSGIAPFWFLARDHYMESSHLYGVQKIIRTKFCMIDAADPDAKPERLSWYLRDSRDGDYDGPVELIRTEL